MLPYGLSEGLPAELMNAVKVLIIRHCSGIPAFNFMLQCKASGGLQIKFIGCFTVSIIWSSFSFFLPELDSAMCKCCIPSLIHSHLVVFVM